MPTNEQISVVLTANIDNYKKNMSIASEALKDLQKQSQLFTKINQSVTDSFTKIDFAAKQFGETVGVLEKKLEVIKKGMTNLVVAGEQNTKAFKDLDNQYRIITNRLENKAMAEAQAYAASNMANSILPQTKKGLDAASESLKKSNTQWTSLALVIQDLPYGFRGIQNNLPALFGSLATGTGAAYFAFSALIAVITAWDMGMFGAKKSVDAFAESTKKLNDEIKNSLNYSTSNVQKLQALVAIGNDYTKSEILRAKALKEIKNELGKVNKEEADKIKNIEDGTQAVYTYTAAIRAQQLAEVTGKKIAELQLQISEDRNKIASATGKGVHILDWLGLTDSDLQAAQNRVIQAEGLLRRLEDLNISATIQGLNNPYTKTQAPAKIKEPKEKKIKVKKEKIDYFDILKTTKEFYDAKLNYAEGDDAAQKEILYREKQTLDELIANNQISYNDYYKNVSTIYKSLVDFQIREDKRLLDSQIYFAKQRAGDVQTELGIQEKLHKNSLNSRIEDTKIAMAKLAAMAAMSLDPASMAIYLEMFEKLNAKLKGYGEQWDSTSKQIQGILEGVMADSITKFAENIGKAIAGENVDLFGGMIDIIAEGALGIGKALIAYGVALEAFKLAKLNPLAAIAAGVGLVIAGSFLKSTQSKSNKTGGTTKKFANGGIISGPTMGLMGEYPGAQNNPEVVAPLDKLKGLMGGGGTLEARISGNDLLILVNKAQRNNNLSF